MTKKLIEKLTKVVETWSEHVKNAIKNLKPGP